MLTVEEIDKRVQEIAKKKGDPEMAHSMEDSLLEDVLTAIVDGSFHWYTSPAKLARAALKVKEIEFERWCA